MAADYKRWLVGLGVFLLGVGLGCTASPADKEASLRATRARLATQLDARGMELGAPVYVRIFKEESELEVWVKKGEAFELLQTWPICRWSGQLGPKLREGDGQAPEGFYSVDRKALHPGSRFHLAFNLGFPNAYDQAQGRTGSFLMVHGNCVSVGCYAMTDAGIEPIYALVEAALDGGQGAVPVHIFPFRMTQEALAARSESPWAEFWKNLQEGYLIFEKERRPPRVEVSVLKAGARYEVRAR